MTAHDDRDLRSEFAALRGEEAARTPSFVATVAAARSRSGLPPRRRMLAVVAAAVLAGVALTVLFMPHQQGGGIDLATVHWQSPTDFLLRLPSDDLLRTVPKLGVAPSTIDWRIP